MSEKVLNTEKYSNKFVSCAFAKILSPKWIFEEVSIN